MIVAVQGISDLAVVPGGTALPAENSNLISQSHGTNLLANGDISVFTRSPRAVMVEFWPTVAGVLSVKVTRRGVTTSTALIGGATIQTVPSKQQDIVYIGPEETVNFTYSATGGTYRMIVREI